jgi:hypothetical protein
LARLIATELAAIQGVQPAVLTAADVARQFGLSRGWVYRHARELGGQRMGKGPKARLRFTLSDVQRRLGGLQIGDNQADRPTKRAVPEAELLAIGPRGGPAGASRLRPEALQGDEIVIKPRGRHRVAPPA